MEMSAPDNANPTILSASQLPTRQAKQKKVEPRKGPDSRFSDIVYATPAYLAVRPPLRTGVVLETDGFEDDDDFEPAAEPIDEQEIYGKDLSSISFPFLFSVKSRLGRVAGPCGGVRSSSGDGALFQELCRKGQGSAK